MNEYLKDFVRASKGDYIAWTLTSYNYNTDIRGKVLKGKVSLNNRYASCKKCLLCTYSYNNSLSCEEVNNFSESISSKELIYSNVSKVYPDLNFERDNLDLINKSILFILVIIFLFRFIGSIFRRS